MSIRRRFAGVGVVAGYVLCTTVFLAAAGCGSATAEMLAADPSAKPAMAVFDAAQKGVILGNRAHKGGIIQKGYDAYKGLIRNSWHTG